MPAPTTASVKAYLISQSGSTSWTDPDITFALTAESAAQAKVCRIPAVWDDATHADLGEALCRRVARNLAMRALPLGLAPAVSPDGSAARIGTDPEIRRLEAPYKKRTLG